jgi:hypothetical protein
MRQRVVVWGKPMFVEVHQQSPSVWVAVGDYMGQRIEAKDRTAMTAAKRWSEAARSRGA